MPKEIQISPLKEAFVEAILQTNGGAAWNGGMEKWSQYLSEHLEKKRLTLVAHFQKQPVGYGSLIFKPHYRSFADQDIPEISDLVVAENWRGKGIASTLLDRLEDEARRLDYRQIGLGVGLYADYGPAQRLYAGKHYVVDGLGITSHNEPVVPGSMVKVDDDLVLWLTKSLGP